MAWGRPRCQKMSGEEAILDFEDFDPKVKVKYRRWSKTFKRVASQYEVGNKLKSNYQNRSKYHIIFSKVRRFSTHGVDTRLQS